MTDLLIIFIAWRLRHVAARPRVVLGLDKISADARYGLLKPNIDAFIAAIQQGDDLTKYLSLEPRTKGYSPAAEAPGNRTDRWADKDMILNVMGLHHFHLGMATEAAGHAARTDDLIFASVDRDNFEIVGLFNHAAFEHEDDGTMSDERERIWSVYSNRLHQSALPGQLAIGGYGSLGVTLSSHPVPVVRAAQDHMRIVAEIDPKLDERAYINDLFPQPLPNNPKLTWFYQHLDFGLLEEKTQQFLLFRRGPN